MDKGHFKALFMLGAEDDEMSVENVDAQLHLPDGTRWSATFMTPREIERIMNRWRTTGEEGGGAYFQCRDLVVVPSGGVTAMVSAFEAILDSGGPEGYLQLLGTQSG
ncbi:hypothetical protein [Amycolatopsis sp. NPDC021455]|uniref:hypothetical protein n=1 Tax=Amycolatopsis sp. NPDC021455 TaxID=3154901 RepID=UPI0033CBDD83